MHMGWRISGSQRAVRLDYLPVLRRRLAAPLHE